MLKLESTSFIIHSIIVVLTMVGILGAIGFMAGAASSAKTCADFDRHKDAVRAFLNNPIKYASLDGDKDDKPCEIYEQ